MNIKIGYSANFNCAIEIPGDKSLSHRAIIFSALAKGKSRITNLLESQDIFATINLCRILGVEIYKKNYDYHIISNGINDFNTVKNIKIDFQNSGTSCRCCLGMLVGIGLLHTNIIGDHSLSNRPMQRVIEPLRQMGAFILAKNDNKLPIFTEGRKLTGINYNVPIPSAQVKTSLLIAGLFSEGKTILTENYVTRNHTENFMKFLELPLTEEYVDDKKIITIPGNNKNNICGFNYNIPADFSSASFFIALALITNNSSITMKKVLLNKTRTAFLSVLLEMGADIKFSACDTFANEPFATLIAKSSKLKGIIVKESLIPNMIDEIIILAVVASFAEGATVLTNLKELTTKESDRLQALVINFKKLGIKINYSYEEYSLTIHGSNNQNLVGDVHLSSFSDHRMAMGLSILATKCTKHVNISDIDNIATSFPKFYNICRQIGMNIL